MKTEGDEENKEVASTSQKAKSIQSNQPNIQEAFSNANSYASGGSKHHKLTKSIVKMIVMDNLPFSHVEGKGFLKLMKEHHPLYKVPTRKTMKDQMEKMYEEELKK